MNGQGMTVDISCKIKEIDFETKLFPIKGNIFPDRSHPTVGLPFKIDINYINAI